MKVIDWHPDYSKNFWEKCCSQLVRRILNLRESRLAHDQRRKTSATHSQQWYDEKEPKVYNNYMMDWYDDAVDFISPMLDTEWDTPFWRWVKDM